MLALVLAAHLALTPRTPISTEVIRSAPGTQTRPAIASNGVDYFAAWEHRGDVIGSRIRPDGTTVDTNLGISLQPTWVYDLRPSVIWNGETWVVVFFSGPQPWPYGPKAVEVNVGGEVITERQLVPGRDMTAIDVAWNGSQYLVLWCEGTGEVRAQRFDRGFAPIGEELLLAPQGAEVSVASAGGSWLVAWTRADGTDARLVSSDGALMPAMRIAPSALDVDVASNGISYAVFASDIVAIDATGVITARKVQPPAANVAIIADGARWAASWQADDRVFVAELDASMQFTRDPERLVAQESTQRFPAIANAGGRSLVLFAETTDQYLVDVRSAFVGEPQTTRLVSSGLMVQEPVDAAWSASTLGVLWYEGEVPGSGLRFGELTAEGVPLHGEGIALADGFGARIASNGRGFAVAVRRGERMEVDLLPSGITVVLDDQNPAFPLIASDGRDYFVVWARNGVDVVGRKVGSDGTLGELRPFGARLNGATSRQLQDIVWDGRSFYVLTYEVIGTKVVSYLVTATLVGATGEPGLPIVLEGGNAIYHGYQGRLAWNGESILYARSTVTPGGVVARVGLSGTDFVVREPYAELNDVVWDRGEWLYSISSYGYLLVRGDESIAFDSVLPPRIAKGGVGDRRPHDASDRAHPESSGPERSPRVRAVREAGRAAPRGPVTLRVS